MVLRTALLKKNTEGEMSESAIGTDILYVGLELI